MPKKQSEEKLLKALKLLAPGEPLREGIDNILRAETGALIVLANPENVAKLAEGGFTLDVETTPNVLYELSKMDGAILVTEDGKRIYRGNCHLIPDPSIPSDQTGTRHRAAERMAKQTGNIVIALSEERRLVTLFVGEERHILSDLPVLLAKASQALQTLEKYRSVYDHAVQNLDALELEDFASVNDVAIAVQQAEMVLRVQDEVMQYVLELGREGRLVQMQMQQLVMNVGEDLSLILRDHVQGRKDPAKTSKEIHQMPLKDLLDATKIADLLGFGSGSDVLDKHVTPRGYRMLRKLPRLTQPLPLGVIEKLIGTFNDLQGIIHASSEELDDVEGIGEVRAQAISDGLRRVREQTIISQRGRG